MARRHGGPFTVRAHPRGNLSRVSFFCGGYVGISCCLPECSCNEAVVVVYYYVDKRGAVVANTVGCPIYNI